MNEANQVKLPNFEMSGDDVCCRALFYLVDVGVAAASSSGVLSPRRNGSAVLTRPAIVPAAAKRRLLTAPLIQPMAAPAVSPQNVDILEHSFEADTNSSETDTEAHSLGKIFLLYTFLKTKVNTFFGIFS